MVLSMCYTTLTLEAGGRSPSSGINRSIITAKIFELLSDNVFMGMFLRSKYYFDLEMTKSAIHNARAWMVEVGLTAPAVTNILPSITYKLSTS